jgi:hypothetical protein
MPSGRLWSSGSGSGSGSGSTKAWSRFPRRGFQRLLPEPYPRAARRSVLPPADPVRDHRRAEAPPGAVNPRTGTLRLGGDLRQLPIADVRRASPNRRSRPKPAVRAGEPMVRSDQTMPNLAAPSLESSKETCLTLGGIRETPITIGSSDWVQRIAQPRRFGSGRTRR